MLYNSFGLIIFDVFRHFHTIFLYKACADVKIPAKRCFVMKYVRSHKILFFYGIIIIIGIVFNLLSFFWFDSFDPKGLKLGADAFNNGDQTLAYRLLNHADEQRMAFSAHIPKDELNFSDDGNYAVMVSQLNGQAYSVYFNGTFLGTVGDMQSGNSNIWNSVDSFYFDRRLVNDDNVLRIEILSLYDRGLSFMPVFILPSGDLGTHLCYAKFFTEGIVLLSIGFCVFASIIVLKLFLMSSPKNRSFIYFGLAILFLGGYLLDYTSSSYMPLDYLVYKKLVFGCLYTSMSFASLGMYRFFHRKSHLVLSIITFAGYMLGAVFISDIIAFKAFYNYYNLLIVLNLLNWIATSVRYFKKTDEAKMFFIGNVCLLLCALIDVYMTVSGRLFSLTTPYTYAFIFSLTSIILFFREFINKDQQLKLVNDAHQESYFASITDGMTGLYNHRYLLDVLTQTPPPYSAAMLDIDDFKNINDTFGHRFGDTIIQFVAQSLSNGVRSTDIVFRYGGDEFFIIFPKCTVSNARDVVKKIQTKLKEKPLYFDGQDVRVTFSCGIYYVSNAEDAASVLDRVDRPLYVSKNEGKDRITVFNAAG